MGLRGWGYRKIQEMRERKKLANLTHFAEEQRAYEKQIRIEAEKRGKERAIIPRKEGMGGRLKKWAKEGTKRGLFQPDFNAIDRALTGNLLEPPRPRPRSKSRPRSRSRKKKKIVIYT